MKRIIYLFASATLFISCHKETTTIILSGPDAVANNQSLGKSAHDLLGADRFTTLSIEIQYAPGMQPQEQSVNNLISFLNTYLNKPGGISVSEKQVGSIGKSAITADDAAVFERSNRTAYTQGNTIAVYIYFADAGYTQSNVLGVAYKNTSMVILEKTIQTNSGGLNQAGRVKVETGVMEHEFGHLLGLVNSGTAMVTNHEYSNNKGHCNNSNCLMYYQVQTSGLMSSLNNSVPTLDANCVNDLKANGGK